MMIKFFVYGFNFYWKFYKIEFYSSIFGLIESFLNCFLNTKKEFFIFLRFISIFRFVFTIRVLNEIKSLKNVFKSLILSLPMIINMLGLFIVNLFIFSILGCFFFRHYRNGTEINEEFNNFKNLLYAMMTLFKCATGDEWSIIMIDIDLSKNFY